jgi:molybdopterin-guanine dinucleotide biosynthesis protein A
MDRSELTGIILAGGKSNRMGREKGLVGFHGKSLIQYGIDLLKKQTDKIILSSGNPDYKRFGLEMVPDGVTGQGPAGGIASALKHSTTPWNMVIACDLPFLEPELIDALLANAEGFQAVIPLHDGRSEPLAGLYHKDLWKTFDEAISKGDLALHRILAACNVFYLETGSLTGKYTQMFANINTISELDRDLHTLPQKGSTR